MPSLKSSQPIFLWPPPKKLARLPGTYRPGPWKSRILQTLQPHLPEGAYILEIHPQHIHLQASAAAGWAAAAATLAQLERAVPKPWPCLRIEDSPDFPVRGFMLDVSRDKVPTRNELASLIELLGILKFNHFELYIEHTFAFPGHGRVWRDATPLTAADVDWLQQLCSRWGIEFSANLNSFGHFERWLKHPQYKHLAECPDGFNHPLKGHVPQGTTLRPNAASLRFLDKLWAKFLPLFTSKRFNLGGDEPWELGQGWSKPLVKKYGKHRVYLDFLKKLHRLAAKHGREMLFWGDILLEASALVKEVPPDATALLWGYEANHPFAEQCRQLAAAKRKFWVCPGTSAWNTFTGRTGNMLANIESAAKNGLNYGAEGLLLTSWGDGGNHQPWPVMYPGIVYAAGLAWNRKGSRRADLARAVDLVFQGEPRGFGKTLLEAGRVEDFVKKPRPNRSRHHGLFFATQAELARELKSLSSRELKKTATALSRLRRKLSRPHTLAEQELGLGLDLAAWAVKRAQLTQTEKSTRPLAKELRSLIKRFERLWLKRARPGGLRDAAARMRAVEQEL